MTTLSSSSVEEAPAASGARAADPFPRFTDSTRSAARAEYLQLRLDNKIGHGDRPALGTQGRGGSLDLRFITDPMSGFPVDTACWFIDKKKKQSVICLGEEIGRHLDSDKSKLGAFAQAFIRHEGAHDRWTSRDYPGVVTSAEKVGITPLDINYWEDARIEHRARRNWETEFRWGDFSKQPPMEAAAPYSVLYSFIFNEGKASTVRAQAKKDGVPLEMVDTVRDFYREGIKARRTEDLIDIAVRFRKAFEPDWDGAKPKSNEASSPGRSGDPTNSSDAPGQSSPGSTPDTTPRSGSSAADSSDSGASRSDGSSKDSPEKPASSYRWNDSGAAGNDMKLAYELSSNPDARARLIANSVSVLEPKADKPEESEPGVGGFEGSSADPSNGKIELDALRAQWMRGYIGKHWRRTAPDRINRERVAEIAAALEPAFKGRMEHGYREEPSRRFDAGRHLQDRDDSWRFSQPSDAIGRRSIVLMMDSSSSMLVHESGRKSPSPFTNGQELLAAVSDLAARKKVDAHAVFHFLDAGQVPKHQVVKLPIPDSRLVNFIAYGGGEGIGPALQGCSKLLADADFVGLYTDGNFSDGAIDKEIFRSQGIKLHGLFAGPSHRASALSAYVDHPMIGRDSVELARMLAAEIQQIRPKAR